MNLKITWSVALILIATATISLGHDYWLQAENYFLKSGDRLRFALFAGDDMKPDPLNPTRVLQKKYDAGLSFNLQGYHNRSSGSQS